MAVRVKTGGAASEPFEAGEPQALFGTAFGISQGDLLLQFLYQPTADGQRFPFNVPANEDAGSQPITVVLNWQHATAGAGGGTRPAQ